MELVLIPAKTVVQVNGVNVTLATDIFVEVAYEDMHALTGHHIAHLSEAPAEKVKP